DENGVPTGETVERETAHRNGIRHRTSHVWIARCRDGRVELLLQKRSENKDSHPGCLDISSAGHIPAGCTYLESAIRELKEELSIEATAQELHFCGKKRKAYRKNFHGKEFFDNQVSNVYLLFRNVNIKEIDVQKSEVSEVLWMSFDEVYDMVSEEDAMMKEGENGILQDDRRANRSCIALEEMNMLRDYIADHPEFL
ncbi:MAG: NUDIX domain-containing protein, partial [Wujia sp.]